MGSQVADCAASMEVMRTDARRNVYHNPMAISQVLPALQQKSYLAVRNKECLNEDSMCSTPSTLCGHCMNVCESVNVTYSVKCSEIR